MKFYLFYISWISTYVYFKDLSECNHKFKKKICSQHSSYNLAKHLNFNKLYLFSMTGKIYKRTSNISVTSFSTNQNALHKMNIRGCWHSHKSVHEDKLFWTHSFKTFAYLKEVHFLYNPTSVIHVHTLYLLTSDTFKIQ